MTVKKWFNSFIKKVNETLCQEQLYNWKKLG